MYSSKDTKQSTLFFFAILEISFSIAFGPQEYMADTCFKQHSSKYEESKLDISPFFPIEPSSVETITLKPSFSYSFFSSTSFLFFAPINTIGLTDLYFSLIFWAKKRSEATPVPPATRIGVLFISKIGNL